MDLIKKIEEISGKDKIKEISFLKTILRSLIDDIKDDDVELDINNFIKIYIKILESKK